MKRTSKTTQEQDPIRKKKSERITNKVTSLAPSLSGKKSAGQRQEKPKENKRKPTNTVANPLCKSNGKKIITSSNTDSDDVSKTKLSSRGMPFQTKPVEKLSEEQYDTGMTMKTSPNNTDHSPNPFENTDSDDVSKAKLPSGGMPFQTKPVEKEVEEQYDTGMTMKTSPNDTDHSANPFENTESGDGLDTDTRIPPHLKYNEQYNGRKESSSADSDKLREKKPQLFPNAIANNRFRSDNNRDFSSTRRYPSTGFQSESRAINSLKSDRVKENNLYSTPKTAALKPPPFVLKSSQSTGRKNVLNIMRDSVYADSLDALNQQSVNNTFHQCTSQSASTPFDDALGMRSSESSSKIEKLPSSNEGFWNPIHFVANNLYDASRGEPFSRDDCEENIKKLSKTIKCVDYYPFLELAQSFHGRNASLEQLALGQAFNAIMNNKMIKRINEFSQKNAPRSEDEFVKGIGFDLMNAEKYEETITLPSLMAFKISDVVTPHQASKWTSTKFIADSKSLFKLVIKKVALHDSYFPVYSANESSNNGYFPIGINFYKELTKYSINGFRQTPTKNMESTLTCLARETLVSIMDQFRKEYKTIVASPTTKELCYHLTNQLEIRKLENPGNLEPVPINFSNESPVHEKFRCLSLQPSYKCLRSEQIDGPSVIE